MARKFLSAALLMSVFGLMGCTSARMINGDATSVTVAIPENTNVWPTYYQDAAYAKIKEKFPNFNPQLDVDKVKFEEVIVGQEQRTDQRTDSRPVGKDGKPKGEVTHNTSVTTTTDKKEVWVSYQLGGKLPGMGAMTGLQTPNNTNMTTGNMNMPMNNTGMSTGNMNMPMNNTVVPASGQATKGVNQPALPVNQYPTNPGFGTTGPGMPSYNNR